MQTILIVSGPDFDPAALGAALATQPFAVQLTARGDEALGAVARSDVALVLLDAALAGSASMELIPRLANAGPDKPVPVMVMSSRPSDEEQATALQAGAAGYLRKPFSPQDAAEKIMVELTACNAWPVLPGAGDAAALEVNYHTLLAGSPDAIMLFDADRGLPIDVNRNAERLFGRSAGELMRMRLTELCPPIQPDGRASADAVQELIGKVMAGEIRVFPMSFQHAGGRRIDCEMRTVLLEKNGLRLLHMRLVDVTGERLAEALRTGQNQLLEMIARGAPQASILARLVRLMESQSDGLLCAVMLLDADGKTLHPAAAPSLPRDYVLTLEGQAVGTEEGACGAAVHRRAPVVVPDIERDSPWKAQRAMALAYGLRACWAMPIMLDADTVLGCIAMYYREVRTPRPADERLTGMATHLAGIAIERAQREAELQRHRLHLEELVQARTTELRQAKERAELGSEELSATLENLSATQDELVRRGKLSALGALVAGVAHELNTPIGNSLVAAGAMAERREALSGQLEAGLRRSELEAYLSAAREADSVVLRNLERAARLIDSFRQIAADADAAQRQHFLLDELVTQQLASMEAALPPPRPVIRRELTAGLAMDSYPAPLAHALESLFENSILHGLAGRQHGIVTVGAAPHGKDEAALWVEDNGAGIPPEHLGRVYDPFFTTRLGAGSSGLGLYILHNIVTGVLGGRVEAASEPGKGARFTLILPRTAPR
ncbi:ATP-binding protein [Massilia endophytica]|uniref:ATP-binding protein n=1 Tax=Massilia endophytica TaxID=2899220 RepID=UPI001E3E9531|nr:ATP-binding protein [Massilia endophytica]UGQ48126.1 ATP-binding protein [Massilia endophytica]